MSQSHPPIDSDKLRAYSFRVWNYKQGEMVSVVPPSNRTRTWNPGERRAGVGTGDSGRHTSGYTVDRAGNFPTTNQAEYRT